MKNIVLIGTSMHDHIFLGKDVKVGQCNKGSIVKCFGGSMHNIAFNLGCLDTFPIFFTKLGNDEVSGQIQDSLTVQGVEVHPFYVDKPTPIFQSILGLDKPFFLSTITPDFYFNNTDTINYSVFIDSIGTTDCTNEEFLEKLFVNTPSTRWILSGFIPNANLLNYVEGIVLNEDEYIEDENYFNSNLQWIILTRNSRGARLLRKESTTDFPTKSIETTYTLGAGDAFMSAILFGLSKNKTIEDSIQLAHKAAEIILQTPSPINKDLTLLKLDN